MKNSLTTTLHLSIVLQALVRCKPTSGLDVDMVQGSYAEGKAISCPADGYVESNSLYYFLQSQNFIVYTARDAYPYFCDIHLSDCNCYFANGKFAKYKFL